MLCCGCGVDGNCFFGCKCGVFGMYDIKRGGVIYCKKFLLVVFFWGVCFYFGFYWCVYDVDV